jgi:hypothetical protein
MLIVHLNIVTVSHRFVSLCTHILILRHIAKFLPGIPMHTSCFYPGLYQFTGSSYFPLPVFFPTLLVVFSKIVQQTNTFEVLHDPVTL